MTDETERFRSLLNDAIANALRSEPTASYHQVLKRLGGADPPLVYELYRAQTTPDALEKLLEAAENYTNRRHAARRKSAELPLQLPAPDPMASQWWFTLDSLDELCRRAWTLRSDSPVAFLGAPTAGFHFYHLYGGDTLILDCDQDVLECLGACKELRTLPYNVAKEPPPPLVGKCGVVVTDPPWYRDLTLAFLARARALLDDGGYILLVLPPRETRPDVITQRSELLAHLLGGGFEILSLDTNAVAYRVPAFEARALRRIDEFEGTSWRGGDLLTLCCPKDSMVNAVPTIPEREDSTYSREPTGRRYFMRPSRADPDLPVELEPIQGFEANISTRDIEIDRVAVWSSEKHGLAVRDHAVADIVLTCWSEGKDTAAAEAALKSAGIKSASATVESFDEALQLWRQPGRPSLRRTHEELTVARDNYVSSFASSPTDRKYQYDDDQFRLGFQRDRDRVLWSHALKRLANKTQLFPVKSDDQLRRRLAHSIEVMQLASTIAVAFGLDRDLTEAAALAHDIGHAPFGHAGEYALNQVLDEIDEKLHGFNHYEHGVDTLRWIEDVYRSPGAGSIPGLNLTPETIEGVFKHTFHRGNQRLGQKWLARRTKHPDLNLENDVSCHLEGQAVRIADKVSYLISDLEDGIRMGAIRHSDLARCRVFERPPIDTTPAAGESLFERFVSQRRAILKVLMEDILLASDRRLRNLKGLQAVRSEDAYQIDFSDTLRVEIGEVWHNLQAGVLHRHGSVQAENTRAARIVRDLFLLFVAKPKLVDETFRRGHSFLDNSEYMAWYRDRMGDDVGIPKRLLDAIAYVHTIGTAPKVQGDNYQIPTKDVVQAKDYVASLTDKRAMSEHARRCQLQ